MQDQRNTPNYYAGPYLDRDAGLREDPDWFEAARADSQTLYLVTRGTAHLLVIEPEPRIAFLDRGHPLVARLTEDSAVLLGRYGGARCVLVDLGDQDAAYGSDQFETVMRFEELRPLSSLLPEHDAALLAYARALSVWRSRHRHCGTCGTRTLPKRAGHVLACTNPECRREVFPRIDPAIIVLVTDGDRALLGRQANWPPGRYSTIAGFVEPGESLEDAVAREVYEEAGVRISRATYHSSQPWPFPSSLMLGFMAQASTFAITRRDEELEDASWFTRAEIAAGHPMLPTPTSISFRLIQDWFDAGPNAPLREQPNVALWDTRRERR